MPEQAPVMLNKKDRVASIQALQEVMKGVSAMAKAFALTPGEQSVAGELLRLKKEDLIRMMQSSFSVAEFASEMTKQLQWLETETGIKARVQEAPNYNGVVFPTATVDVKIDGDSLVAVIEAESSVMPGQTVRKDVHIIKVGDKDALGTETMMDDIKAVKAAWDAAHPAQTQG